MTTLASGKLSEQFEDFLKSVTDRSGNPVYRSKISQLISSEGKSMVVDFGDLLKYNSDLANRVLLEPILLSPRSESRRSRPCAARTRSTPTG